MQPSRRHPSGSLRAVLRTVAAALAAAVLLGAAGAGPALAGTHPQHAHAAHKSPASHKGWVKFFIVAPPKNGAKEFLFEIAAATLGQGSKAQEIFNLNKGRLQPDGNRLEDPTTILPGWILILPSNAHGPDVHFGPLPKVKPLPSPSASPSLSLSPSPVPRPTPVRHQRTVTPAAGPGHRVIEAGIGGALLVALLLAIGLLLMRRRKSGNKRHRPDSARPPAVQAVPGGRAGPRRAGPGAGAARRGGSGSRLRGRNARQADPGMPAPLPQATVLARDPSPPMGEAGPDGRAGVGQPAEPGPLATPATPAWLAPPALEELDAAAAAQPRSPAMPALPGQDVPAPDVPAPDVPAPDVPAPDVPAPDVPGVGDGRTDEDVAWPDYLSAAAPDVTSAAADVPPWLAHDGGTQATEPPPAGPEPELPQQRLETDRLDADRLDADGPETAFSPVALRLLGAERSVAQRAEDAGVPVQRHDIGFGEDRIEIVLGGAPAASQDSRPRNGHTWLTATPYLAWTALPYEAPDGGTAFACLGVGDEGCLFIDLAAAPGAVAIGGDRAAATRLAESIVHQLGMSPTSGPSRVVIVVGAAVPEPHPAAALSVASLEDLASVSETGADDAIEIVFSELRSDADAFALARYVASNQRRVVPVVLADLPDAPWAITAHPGLRPSDTTGPARSSDALDPASA